MSLYIPGLSKKREHKLEDFLGEDNPEEAFAQALADDELFLKGIRSDSMQKLKTWTEKYPSPATAGTPRQAVPSLSMVGGLAPVDQGALYGQAQAYPGIASIVNMKKRQLS